MASWYRRSAAKNAQDWAITLINRGVPWERQQLGTARGNTLALYLTESRQWFAPAVDLTRADLARLDQCDEAASADHNGDPDDLHVFVGFPGGCFRGYRRGWRNDVGLYHCLECNMWWFLETCGGWACRCCGASAGNAHVDQCFEGCVSPWPYLDGRGNAL